MKVAQEIDVDNVTIIINPQNKLQAVGSSLEFEEIALKKDEMNPALFSPFELEGSHRYHERKINLTKLFKLKGTDFYLFGGELEEIVRPLPPDPVFRYIAPNDGVFGYGITGESRWFNFAYTNYHLTEGWDYQDRIATNFHSEKYDHLFPEEGYRFYIEREGIRKEFKLIKNGSKVDLYDNDTNTLLEGDVELFPYSKTYTHYDFTPDGQSVVTPYSYETVLYLVFDRENASFTVRDRENRYKHVQLHWSETYDTYGSFYIDAVSIGRYD